MWCSYELWCVTPDSVLLNKHERPGIPTQTISPYNYRNSSYMSEGISTRLLLGRQEVGRLLGVGGKTIVEVRKRSEAKIHIDKDGSKDRIVTISGNRACVISAVETVAELTQSSSQSISNKSLKLLLLDAQCKELVRDGGNNLKSIRKDTGVKMTVEPHCLPGSLERVVQICEDRG